MYTHNIQYGVHNIAKTNASLLNIFICIIMKKMNFLAAVCCMLAVFTACEKNEPTDDNTNVNAWCGSSGIVSDPTGSENGYGYVDLGLSVKWATCNVGASKPEEYGDYFAWGETETKTYYWYTVGYYKWEGKYGLTKYNTGPSGVIDNKTVLELADDAAHVNWGGSWRMPTKDECQELIDNCTDTRTYDYNGTGVEGVVITSNINGNSIFLPAAGYRHLDDLCDADYCHYWSSSLDTDNSYGAWSVYFYSDHVYRMYFYRCDGLPVRPVLGE